MDIELHYTAAIIIQVSYPNFISFRIIVQHFVYKQPCNSMVVETHPVVCPQKCVYFLSIIFLH